MPGAFVKLGREFLLLDTTLNEFGYLLPNQLRGTVRQPLKPKPFHAAHHPPIEQSGFEQIFLVHLAGRLAKFGNYCGDAQAFFEAFNYQIFHNQ